MRSYADYSAVFPSLVQELFKYDMPSSARPLFEEVLADESADHAGVSHSELLSRTADSLGIVYDSELLTAIRTEINLYANSVAHIIKINFGHALGALGPATEWIVPTIYEKFVEWWSRTAPDTATDQFFAFHVGSDELHGELFKQAIILCFTTNTVSLSDVERGAGTALKARARLWGNLADLCSTTQDHASTKEMQRK
jgi:hypothetical protein